MKIRLLPVLALLIPLSVTATEFYRYVDKNGITVISRQGVPSDVIGNGYDVLNEQGRVIRVVPRALTPEEYRQLQEEKKQADLDRQLLRLYNSIEDVDRAMARKVAEVEAYMGNVRRNMLVVQENKATLLGDAAEQERAGKQPSADLLAQIEQAERQERNYLQELERYQALREEVVASFSADRERVAGLLSKKSPNKN